MMRWQDKMQLRIAFKHLDNTRLYLWLRIFLSAFILSLINADYCWFAPECCVRHKQCRRTVMELRAKVQLTMLIGCWRIEQSSDYNLIPSSERGC